MTTDKNLENELDQLTPRQLELTKKLLRGIVHVSAGTILGSCAFISTYLPTERIDYSSLVGLAVFGEVLAVSVLASGYVQRNYDVTVRRK
ncbi:MAG: hypothetical protein AABX04_02790 [Nanoarchaeota archaeon]